MSAKAKTGHERIIETVKIALYGGDNIRARTSFGSASVYTCAGFVHDYGGLPYNLFARAKTGTVSVIIYILLGLAGVPVFSGFTGGAAKLVGPTGGYIIGFIFIAVIGGVFVDKFKGKFFFSLLGMALRNGCLLPFSVHFGSLIRQA